MVDAPSSGGGVRKDVLVRIQSRALLAIKKLVAIFFIMNENIGCVLVPSPTVSRRRGIQSRALNKPCKTLTGADL